jgi:multidrug resistance efflux pump
MTDLDQEGISGRLRARFSTYQDGPPRRRYLLLAVVVVVLGLAGYSGYLLYYWHYHISTDDAYITARIAPMSARIPGTVIEVLVNDNQDVKADQVLVRLDPRDYEVAVAQARAAVVSAGRSGDRGGGRAADRRIHRSLVQQADAASGRPSSAPRWRSTISRSAAACSRPSRRRWRRPTRRCAPRRPTTRAARTSATAWRRW